MNAMMPTVIRIPLVVFDLFITLFNTVCAYSVKNRTPWIQSELMLLKKVIPNPGKLFAFHMDKAAAFFTFAVKAQFLMPVVVMTVILKTGRTVCIYDVLINNTFVHKALQLSVNC